jgi:hypothetical protein
MVIAKDYNPHRSVYRSSDIVRGYTPLGFARLLVAMLLLVMIFAKG